MPEYISLREYFEPLKREHLEDAKRLRDEANELERRASLIQEAINALENSEVMGDLLDQKILPKKPDAENDD